MPVVEATFVMDGRIGVSPEESASLEQAMIEAIEQAQSEGITDPDTIRSRILAARDNWVGQ